MENDTSFDLNRAIQNWRENLAQSTTVHREDLDELETHIRDSMVGLQSSGLSLEESFVIAMRRFDRYDQIAGEFQKIGTRAGWSNRMKMLFVAVVLLLVGAGISESIIYWDRPQWLALLLSKPLRDSAMTHAPQVLELRTYEKGQERARAFTSSLIVQDPRTGEIMAIVGGNSFSPANLPYLEKMLLRGSSPREEGGR